MWRKKRTILSKSLALPAAIAILMLPVWSSITLAAQPIVGLWQVTWTDPFNGQVINLVWDTWHSDRTETQNDSTNSISSAESPVGGSNVSQGAWLPLGNRTYGLTHPAFNFLDSPEDQEGNLD